MGHFIEPLNDEDLNQVVRMLQNCTYSRKSVREKRTKTRDTGLE